MCQTMKNSREVHLFIDISNILVGAKGIAKSQSQRLNVQALSEVVCGQRKIARKVAVGSVEIRNYNIKNLDAEEKPWKDAEFEITFLQRVPSVVGRYSEQSVDDVIHAAIQKDLLKTFESPRTLVLLTGDGNTNSGRTTFPEVIEAALSREWDVEVWAWSTSISSHYYHMAKVYDRNLVVKLLDPFLSQVTISPDEDRRKRNDNLSIINTSCSDNKSVVNINKKKSKNKNKKKRNISNGYEINFDYNIPANNIMCWERSNLIPGGIATNGQLANGQMANVREFDRAQRLKNRQQQQQQLQGLNRRSCEEQKRKLASIEIIDLCDVDDYEDQNDYQEIEDDEEEDEGQVYYVEKETDTHSNHITCGMIGKDFLQGRDESSISPRALVGIIPVENIYARRGDDDDDHQDHFNSNAHNYDDVAFSGNDSDDIDQNEDNDDDASVTFCIDRSMAAKINKSYRNDNCQQFNRHNEINSGIVQCSSSNSSISASSSSSSSISASSSSSSSSSISVSSSSSSSSISASSSIPASNSSCTENLDEDNHKILFIDDCDVRIQINSTTNCDNDNALHHLESDMSVLAHREINNDSYNDSNNDNKSNSSNNNNNHMNGKSYDNLINNDIDDSVINSNGNSNSNKGDIFVGSTQCSILDLIDLTADSPTDNRTYGADENSKRDSLESVEIIYNDQNEEEENKNGLIRNKIDDFQQSEKSIISDFRDSSPVLEKRKIPLEETEEYSFAKKKLCVESEQKDLEKLKEISNVGEFKLFSSVSKSINKVMPLAADSGSNDIDTTSTYSLSKIMNHVSYYRDKKGNTYSRTNDNAFYNS